MISTSLIIEVVWQIDLKQLLCRLVPLLTCSNRRCTIPEHRSDIVNYANHIADNLVEAGLNTVPQMRPNFQSTPGFSEHVKPYREESMFWHNLWIDRGRPKTGHVANCMRRTRAAYHYAVRRVQRDKDVGSLAYADDLVILALPSVALRKMLKICYAYGLENNISFNAKKSKCLVALPPSRRYLKPTVKECTFYVGDVVLKL